MINYLEKNCEEVGKIKTIPENSFCLIYSFTKIFINSNFKTRKIIIKAMLGNLFFRFFEKEPSTILLILAFLAKINEEAVYNITLGKLFKHSFEATDLSENQIF